VKLFEKVMLNDPADIAVFGLDLAKASLLFKNLGFLAVKHFVGLLCHKVGLGIKRRERNTYYHN
jgi:hypothetical protein